MIPLNSEFKPSGPMDGTSGIKGSLEAVQRGLFLGIEFDYAEIESKNPLPPQTPNGSTKTERLMENFDAYKLFLTIDYDVPLGDYQPDLEKSKFDFYSPIFRFGLGLGAICINASEAPGNTLTSFDKQFQFVGRPTVSFLFPFHPNFAVFIEGNFDWVPKIRMTGSASGESVNIGDNSVDFSTANIWFGLSFQF
jgi:hypothetical protein